MCYSMDVINCVFILCVCMYVCMYVGVCVQVCVVTNQMSGNNYGQCQQSLECDSDHKQLAIAT